MIYVGHCCHVVCTTSPESSLKNSGVEPAAVHRKHRRHQLARVVAAHCFPASPKTSASERLNEGGEIIFSNNKRNFKLDIDAIKALGFYIKDISKASIPEDFKRNFKIHQCWILTKHD